MSLQNISWSQLQVGALVGHGSFGDVFRGTWYGKAVAVKKLLLKNLKGELAESFANETKIMAECQSERIVRLFAICNQVGNFAMIMEFMDKGSLYDILKDNKVDLPWSLRTRLGLEVSEGLAYLHSKKIIHRDLKSLNVLLDANLHAKITDFGLSKIKVETSSTSTKTHTAGTVRWQAPELFKRGAVHSTATDVYSLGMVLWEIAARKIPFADAPNETTAAMWINQGEQETLPSDCPEPYGALVKRCWLRAEARPTAAALVEALRKAMPKEAPIVQKPWHFDLEVKNITLPEGQKYALMSASPKDVQKVLGFYMHHPVPGYEVGSVQVIHNPAFNRMFELQLSRLQERHQNPAFAPKWSWDTNPDWRKKVYEVFEQISKSYVDPDFPQVKLLPLWHGTDPKILDSIFRTGFANLATTDAGFFGKGLYSAYEAEYAHRVYSKGALLLNWVATYSPYPVIDGDMGKLAEKANYQNYDSHFAPVVSKTGNPHDMNYYPCKPNQKHTYKELVVFESAACLPRYVVQLQAVMKQTLAPQPSPVPKPSAPSVQVAPAAPKPSAPSVQVAPAAPKPSASIVQVAPAAPKPSASSVQVVPAAQKPSAPSVQVAPTAPKPVAPLVPPLAFGKAKWAQYFGDIGLEPPLPANITTILQGPCPFWPGKCVEETHILVLIPKTVNGQPLTLRSLCELVKRPKQGHVTKCKVLQEKIMKSYGDKSVETSHWVLMTKDVLPGTREKSYAKQKQIFAKFNTHNYKVPHMFEAAIAILMHYVRDGVCLFSYGDFKTNTRCKESTGDQQHTVGNFDSGSLHLYYGYHALSLEDTGLAVLRKF